MKTGAAYIRVSTEDQLEYSPDSQRRKLAEYADAHDILLPDAFFFVDEGISGRHAANRPAFMNMIQTARQKPRPFEIILVWKFSRFARNRQDSIMYKTMLRKECHVEVVSVTEQLSTDPASILVEALLEAMDEYYSVNLGQEVRRGMNEKFIKGGVVCAPPFGYRMGEKCFLPEQTEAAAVRFMYEACERGDTPGRIAGQLNERGVRTRRGNLFEARTVKYVLTNPIYIGWQRRQTKEREPKDRFLLGEQVQFSKALHTPLISDELFFRVQKCLLPGKSHWDHQTD